MRKIYTLILAIVTLVACDKPIEFERTLGLMSEYNVLPSSGGSTDVPVFSNTSWTAKFQQPVKWASLDRLAGEGCSRVVFSYERNYGRSRRVILEFQAAGEVRTLNMYQETAITDADCVIEILNPLYDAPAEGGEKNFSLNTNLVYDLERFNLNVVYEVEPAADWIHLVSVSADEMVVLLDKNETGAARKANVKLSHTDAGGYNSVMGDTLYSNVITITQQ